MSEHDTVSKESKLLRIRHNQDLALELIIGEQPDLALSLLEDIDKDVQECEGTFEWAMQPFLLAKAYAAVNHRVAEVLFNDAIYRMSKLPTCDPPHSLRVHKSFGKYLFGKNRFREAQRQNELAEQFAIALGPSDELYQTHLRIIETRYRINKDRTQERNFEVFKRVADTKHCTFKHQHKAWIKHEQSLQDTTGEALFMRDTRVLDAAYFKHLLDSTRENEVETENAKGE